MLKGLFGKFNPSRGDLVFSKTGELLGVMANSTYCVMLQNFDSMATIRFGQDVRQRGLAQAGRAEQQHMVERLVAHFGGTDENLELLARLGLAHVLLHQLGPQRALDRLLVGRRGRVRHHPLGRRRGKVIGLDTQGTLVSAAKRVTIAPAWSPATGSRNWQGLQSHEYPGNDRNRAAH